MSCMVFGRGLVGRSGEFLCLLCGMGRDTMGGRVVYLCICAYGSDVDHAPILLLRELLSLGTWLLSPGDMKINIQR